MGFNQAPALPYRNLGIVEDGDAASQAIEKDKYVIWKGKNYFAKTDILQGESFVVDTNLIEVTDGVINGTVDVLNSNLPANRWWVDRWLRFDTENRKGLVIKAGTTLTSANGGLCYFTEDTKVDLTANLGQVGKDYGVYLLNDGTVVAALLTSAPENSVKIGRFHTLCANVGTITNAIFPAAPSSGLVSGSKYLVKGYKQDEDPDFYALYNMTVSACTVQTHYDKVTCPHPLSGFSAGDILPESVFCLGFYPDCLYEDAMVYDKDTDKCIDVYLQSGSGHNTRSAYNATHRVNRSPLNYQEDMRMIGKRLLTDHEFSSAAIGSNEQTSITGSSDKTYVGGHVDTSNRRMISAIGCEEMCGYLHQWLDEIAAIGGSSWDTNLDGHNSFGKHFGVPKVMRAGGDWGAGSLSGSRCRDAAGGRTEAYNTIGGRGASSTIHGGQST